MLPHLPYSYWPRIYLQSAVVAFVLTVVLMPLAIRWLRRAGVVDGVDEAKLHTRPTPRGGGIVIFIGFAVAVLLPNYRDNPMKGVVLGAFVCLLVGAVDDIRGGVPATIKLATLVLVTWVMSWYGVCLKLFPWYPLNLAVTILWIVGATSAFNGLDNMDGLAGGIAVLVSMVFFTIALQAYLAAGTENSLSWFGLLSAGLIGSGLGFLVYNMRPARVFMGDSGSFFLGFILSALGVMGEWAENPIIACTIPVLILGVPIFDFAYVILARIARGDTSTLRSIVEHCALDHLSHRLCWIGFSQRKAVFFIYLLVASLGVTGVLLRNSQHPIDSLLALAQGLSVIAIVVILMRTASRRHLALIQEEAEKLAELASHGGDRSRQLEIPGTERRRRAE